MKILRREYLRQVEKRKVLDCGGRGADLEKHRFHTYKSCRNNRREVVQKSQITVHRIQIPKKDGNN